MLMIHEIDLRTIIFGLGVTHLMQILVFYHQYRINKTYKGIGWWLMWSAAETLGFFIILLREIFPSLVPLFIILQNTLIISGTAFIYIGVSVFLDRKVNLKIPVLIFAAFFCALLFFLFIVPDFNLRGVVISLTLSVFAFLTAYRLIVHNITYIRTSANFNAAIFVLHGIVFLYRAFSLLITDPAETVFSYTFLNFLPYFDALLVSLIWTFGFIIMVNNRLAAEISEAKEGFQKIFSTSPDASILTTLKDGLIIDVNDGYTTLTGYTREELIGKSTRDFGIWKDFNERSKVIEITRNEGQCDNYEAIFIRKDGTEMTGLMSANIMHLQGVPHLISITRDISKRKMMEESLRESNAFLENLINYANAPIIVWDPRFLITRFNHAFEFLTGYTEAEVKGKSLEILFPSELADHSMALIRKTLTGERWESVEIIIKHNDQSLRTVLWNSATIFGPDGVTPVATIAQGHDITKRKQAEEVINLKNRELQETNAEKDKFFSILAHDLRNPFNALLGYTELLTEEYDSLSPADITTAIGSLRKSSLNLYRLLENLLEWSRIQRGSISFDPRPVNLRTIVNEIHNIVSESASKKQITIQIDIPDDIAVMADPHMVSTIIRNLVFNAIKFTRDEGKIMLSAHVDNSSFVEISIEDNGIGMSQEILNNLFRLDCKFNRSGTAGEASTGLGLIICKDFVDKHGGRISVASIEGAGSTFTVTFPRSL